MKDEEKEESKEIIIPVVKHNSKNYIIQPAIEVWSPINPMPKSIRDFLKTCNIMVDYITKELNEGELKNSPAKRVQICKILIDSILRKVLICHIERVGILHTVAHNFDRDRDKAIEASQIMKIIKKQKAQDEQKRRSYQS